MILDFTKVFPKSCAVQEIVDLSVNTTDIIKCDIDLAVNPWIELIHVGDKVYKFFGEEHGGLIIKQIIMTEQLLTFFEQNVSSIDLSRDSLAESLLNAAKTSMETYKKMYQSVILK